MCNTAPNLSSGLKYAYSIPAFGQLDIETVTWEEQSTWQSSLSFATLLPIQRFSPLNNRQISWLFFYPSGNVRATNTYLIFFPSSNNVNFFIPKIIHSSFSFHKTMMSIIILPKQITTRIMGECMKRKVECVTKESNMKVQEVGRWMLGVKKY